MDYKDKVLGGLDELQSLMILLAHADNDSPVKGKLKLQKIMYLLADKIDQIRELSSYEPDMLGPYSETIDEEAEYLKNIGVFTATEGLISLTKEGKEIANELEKKEKHHVIQYLDDFKRFLNDMSSDELLCYVYSAYPEMIGESVKYKQLLPKMEDTILNLVKKHKISLERASELLKKNPDYTIKKLKEKGISVFS